MISRTFYPLNYKNMKTIILLCSRKIILSVIVPLLFSISFSSKAQLISSAALAGGCYAINGMYVWGLYAKGNTAETILGNTVKENTLLKYARDNGFNYLICYELQQIIPNPTLTTQLATFIKKAKTQYGIQQIGASLGEASQGNLVINYNKTHSYEERIDVLNLESEFWQVASANRAAAFNEVMNTMTTFKSLALNNNMETEIYIGQITPEEGIRIGNTVDRVLVHFYRTTDVGIINYITERLQYLAGANKKVRVAPIFSNEGPTNNQDIPFMGTWLESHPQDQAFKSWVDGYNGLTASWKSNLEIMGNIWFVSNNFMDMGKTSHITNHPISQSVCLGESKTLMVTSSASSKKYYWMKNGTCLSDGGTLSGTKTNALRLTNITNADAGNYYCRIISSDASNPSSFASTNATISISNNCNVQNPYGGNPSILPGTIEAENYDTGGQGVAFNDITAANEGGTYRTDAVDIETKVGGYNVGWIQANEWLEYTINITSSGNYDIQASIASISSNNNFRIEMDGTILTSISTPNTGGWTNWTNVNVQNIPLTAGQKVMRLYFTTGLINLDKLLFSLSSVINQPPSISIIAPNNNTSFTSPASISIDASATDADGTISKVDFYNGATLLYTDNSTPYSYTWSITTIGNYSITAIATDNKSATTTSSSLAIKVISPINNCSGVAAYIENGNYTSGSIVQYSGKQYQCKPYPFSGWCNGAAWAYSPGNGLYWNDAWILIGPCIASANRNNSEETIISNMNINSNPNPFIQGTNITLIVSEDAEVSLKVYDKIGQVVAILEESYLKKGTYDYILEANTLRSDIYIIKCSSNNKVTTKKIFKIE